MNEFCQIQCQSIQALAIPHKNLTTVLPTLPPPHPFPTLHPPHLYFFFVPVIFFIQFPLLITGTILTFLSGGVHFMLLFYSQDSCVCQKQ